MNGYTPGFYDDIREGARRSARAIVPLVLDLLRPRSLVDVGCGTGTWLAVFREHGVDDVLGVDGPWVDRGGLEIPPERFHEADLTATLRLPRAFDLAISLEVAEHLPAACADAFVDTLVGLAPFVLFSAAIPYQGGVHHVNEQWPEYWAERFRRRGYVAVDCLRRRVWGNPDVEYCYAQNLVLFGERARVARRPALAREAAACGPSPLPLVHPRRYLEAIDWMHRWVEDARVIAADLAGLLPPAATFVLVDQDEFGVLVAGGRTALPFLEREGRYWGPPPDDDTAIRELERLRRAGASAVAFARPALWWLQHYAAFSRHLRSTRPCLRQSERLVVYDLREGEGG